MSTKGKVYTVALAGNPNSGKTTIFNMLTGSKQHVGNYPGVTVEKREGSCSYNDVQLRIIDLPGTYSLTARAEDELVARQYILQEQPDVVVNVLDTANLERNLYLSLQLLELGRPLVLALNMADIAQQRGMKVDMERLSRLLGISVVNTVGNRSKGIKELLSSVYETVQSAGKKDAFTVNYGPELEAAVSNLTELLLSGNPAGGQYPARWMAIKLLENDQEIIALVKNAANGDKILQLAVEVRMALAKEAGEDAEMLIANRRYAHLDRIIKEVLVAENQDRLTLSDRLDQVLTSRIFGLPIFFALMWLLFNMVFTLSEQPAGWIEDGVALLGEWAGTYLPDGDLKSLVVDGMIGGVGGVIVFLPNIILLFLGIAILEDSGYMARAAFIMDRIMRAVGLHGKSFIPMLIGFGCGVPAVMGARTLENPRDRLVTILVVPLMSCSARLPVYTVLISAFFASEMAGTVLFSIYLAGIILAILMARIFRSFLLTGEAEPFVMEMPPYHVPTVRSILIHMWERCMLYLKKAGTVILAVSVIIWFLSSYPKEIEYSKDYEALTAAAEAAFTEQVAKEVAAPLNIEKIEDHSALAELIAKVKDLDETLAASGEELGEDSEEYRQAEIARDNEVAALKTANPAIFSAAAQYLELEAARDATAEQLAREQAGEDLAGSYAGGIGHAIEPLIKPLGFDWKIGIALFAGFAAKEVVVSTLGTIYSIGAVDETSVEITKMLAQDPTFSPLVAYTLMLFVLIYVPCLAAMAVIRRETNSWRWTFFTMGYTIALAWIVSFIVYRGGLLLGY
ncbi:ferrous iron transport protein B [Acetonema longum]|uniref:Ferrous iron transport protein B n=1 Tax=Acetonema longum DSM 6540 TaxID=1009370 RepID=F7NMJ0_9FIRM|nr:ferrous iron transport protein B [Acetonema longum]EGO62730.1 ferrous iron transport protein B [Acetonema longum DSM 6540]